MNKNKWFLNGGRESGKTTRLLCETYENKIADLERENAELKSEKGCETCNKFSDIKLTKAKEIIKTFLGFAEVFGYSPSMDKFITEAKQFLKDSEVEK